MIEARNYSKDFSKKNLFINIIHLLLPEKVSGLKTDNKSGFLRLI